MNENKIQTIQKHHKKEEWIIMYANIRGMKSKTTSLTEILEEKNPHIFLIAETLLRTNTGIHVKKLYFLWSKTRR